MKESMAPAKAGISGFRASRAARKKKLQDENRKNGETLRSFWADSRRSTAVLAHNGVIALVWAMAMFLVAYADLQLSFFVVAFILGETGGIMMQTSVDVITVYVTIAMGCGFCLFFGFAVEKALMRAMGRRFWRVDHANSRIDKGAAWNEKHPGNGAPPQPDGAN